MFPTINKRETGVNLRRIMDKRGISAKEVQEHLGLDCVQSVYRWTEGISMLTIDNLYALSELFKVPMDAMVCGNRAPMDAIEKFDARGRRLYGYYEKLQAMHVA